jgi:four helix bundle protein
MAFHVLDTSIRLAATLRHQLDRLAQHDRDLENQARRAANGVALQVSEARRRSGRDKAHLFRVAAGSADELATALRLAEAWGFLDADALAESRALLDRVQAMLWRLTH